MIFDVTITQFSSQRTLSKFILVSQDLPKKLKLFEIRHTVWKFSDMHSNSGRYSIDSDVSLG